MRVAYYFFSWWYCLTIQTGAETEIAAALPTNHFYIAGFHNRVCTLVASQFKQELLGKKLQPFCRLFCFLSFYFLLFDLYVSQGIRVAYFLSCWSCLTMQAFVHPSISIHAVAWLGPETSNCEGHRLEFPLPKVAIPAWPTIDNWKRHHNLYNLQIARLILVAQTLLHPPVCVCAKTALPDLERLQVSVRHLISTGRAISDEKTSWSCFLFLEIRKTVVPDTWDCCMFRSTMWMFVEITLADMTTCTVYR